MENVKRKCCMLGCDNEESQNLVVGENRKLHVFPLDFNLCMLWVQNCGRPEYFEDFAFAGAQPFMNRHICSDHFNNNDFIDPQDRFLGLLPDAVPNLNLILFPKIEVKEEFDDADFTEALADTIEPESELINVMKLEKFENDVCDEANTNFSFSSTDDSCNDLLGGGNLSTGIEIYKETEQDKELSNEFFRKYENAVRRTRTNGRRANETEEERTLRLQREALRAKIRRSQETEEQKQIRRMKNALRAAFRRKNESPEQKALRHKKDMLRAQMRRKTETETEARIRRYNDAVRAAFRRHNETEEQRMERRSKDIMRAAKRRSQETPEERATRLRKDRERASRRRMLKKIADRIIQLSVAPEFAHLEVPIRYDSTENGIPRVMMTPLLSVAAQCKESIVTHSDSISVEQFQQVLEFVEGMNGERRRLRKRHAKQADETCGNNANCTLSNSDGGVETRVEGDVNNSVCYLNVDGTKVGGVVSGVGDEGCSRIGGALGQGCDLTDVLGRQRVMVDLLKPEVVWE